MLDKGKFNGKSWLKKKFYIKNNKASIEVLMYRSFRNFRLFKQFADLNIEELNYISSFKRDQISHLMKTAYWFGNKSSHYYHLPEEFNHKSDTIEILTRAGGDNKKYFFPYRAIKNPNMIGFLSRKNYIIYRAEGNNKEFLLKNGIMMRYGKYLKKYFPKMRDELISKLAEDFKVAGEFKVEEMTFEEIYDSKNYANTIRDGSGDFWGSLNASCMRDKSDIGRFYRMYNCKAYGIKVNEKLVARAIAWFVDDKKYLSRIYANGYDNALDMKRWGEENGFEIYPSLPESISPIKSFDSSIGIPYIDGMLSIDINGVLSEEEADHLDLVCCHRTDMSSFNERTEGSCECDWCGGLVSIEESIVCGDSTYCSTDCASNSGWKSCDRCGDYFHENDDDSVFTDNGYYCSESCANRDDYYKCDECGEYCHIDNLKVADDETSYCSWRCVSRAGYDECKECGDIINLDDAINSKDGSVFCDEKCATDYDYTKCEECGEWGFIEDLLEIDNKHYCDENCLKIKNHQYCNKCGVIYKTSEEHICVSIANVKTNLSNTEVITTSKESQYELV